MKGTCQKNALLWVSFNFELFLFIFSHSLIKGELRIQCKYLQITAFQGQSISYPFIPQTSSEDGGNGPEKHNRIHHLLHQERHYHNRSASMEFPCYGMNISATSPTALQLLSVESTGLLSTSPHATVIGPGHTELWFALVSCVLPKDSLTNDPCLVLNYLAHFFQGNSFLSTSLHVTVVFYTVYSAKQYCVFFNLLTNSQVIETVEQPLRSHDLKSQPSTEGGCPC